MICSKCGTDFTSKFCPNCGTPAPALHTCPCCNVDYTGNFCPDCGAAASVPLEERCRRLIDRSGNPIDVNKVAGLYLSVREVVSFLRKATNYEDSEILDFAEYIYHNINGNEYGIFASATEKRRLEVAHISDKKSTAEFLFGATAVERSCTLPVREHSLSKQERIRENRENGVACCPKCGSTSLSANKKGFGIGKAVVGAALTGGIGLVAGNIGAKTLIVTCLNCGHRWKT